MSTPDGTGVLEIEDRDRVRILRLNRPAKLNALNHALIDTLLGAAADAERDPGAGVVLLAGAGRAFCAGIDLDEIARLPTSAAIRAHARLVARLQSAFREMKKPVLCAVHGYAYGAGCGLVAAADMAIAGRGAQLGYPEIRRDVLPALILPNLVRQVGRKAAFGLVATGLPVSAEIARELGLVNDVVADEDLAATAFAVARTLAARDAVIVAELKRLFVEVGDVPFDQALRAARTTNERCRIARRGRAVSDPVTQGGQ